MQFLKQYIKIINYALMGLVFGFASFYLLTNLYHYLEIRKDFYVDFNTQPLVVDVKDKMNTVTTNISNFDVNQYSGNIPASRMLSIQNNLQSCVKLFDNETIQNMKDKKRITILDVYQLRESYENDILGSCIVNNLYWSWTNANDSNSYINSTYLINNQTLIQLYVDSLRSSETSYLKKDLINNSSYFFNTSVASFIKNNTKDGFYEVLSAYNHAASFVEFLSDWFYNETEGNYD